MEECLIVDNNSKLMDGDVEMKDKIELNTEEKSKEENAKDEKIEEIDLIVNDKCNTIDAECDSEKYINVDEFEKFLNEELDKINNDTNITEKAENEVSKNIMDVQNNKIKYKRIQTDVYVTDDEAFDQLKTGNVLIHYPFLPERYMNSNLKLVKGCFYYVETTYELISIQNQYRKKKEHLTSKKFINNIRHKISTPQVKVHKPCIIYEDKSFHEILNNICAHIDGFAKCAWAIANELFIEENSSLHGQKRNKRIFFYTYCQQLYRCSTCMIEDSETQENSCLHNALLKLIGDDKKCITELHYLFKISKDKILMTKNCDKMKNENLCPISVYCGGKNPKLVNNKLLEF